MNQNIKCLKCSNDMKSVLTKKGVLIDVCPSCQGVWLDYGEINFFVRDLSLLKEYWHFGLDQPHSLKDKCPKCDGSMHQGTLPGFSYQVEKCQSCHGIYLDAHEFKNIQNNRSFNKIQKDTFTSQKKITHQKTAYPVVKLPSFALTTGIVVFSLYGILFGAIVFAIEIAHLPLWVGSLGFVVIVLLQFYFSPIFLDWQLKFLGSLDWVLPNQLPVHFKNSLMKICQNHNIPLPRIGIIRDAAPQAYTYGRTPYSSRVIFSEGMFDLLDEDEMEAVLAHEIGHIKHWDFVLMTVIKIVPIILYNIYSACNHAIRERQEKGGSSGGILGVVIITYIAYLVAEYLVLFVSRMREYYADKFSCFATKKPNKLLTALVKISYGLLGTSSEKTNEKEKSSSYTYRRSVEALNIMGISSSKQLALAQGSEDGHSNPESIKDIMRWDLWNPWAFYYELNSTHPLTAKRINAISSYALSLKQKPYLLFKKQKPESYWDDFFVDLFILLLPYALGVLGVFSYILLTGQTYSQIYSQIFDGTDWIYIIRFGSVFLFCSCVGALIRVLNAYPGGQFIPCCIAALLKIIKVSPVRSYPVLLQGKILGRGDAGWMLSEDFFLKDKTGIIFLNHEPFGLNLWFGLFHFKKLQGKEVAVRGWYRRSPVPYIEVKKIEASDYESRAYTYYYKLAFAVIGIVVSFIALFIFT